LNISLCLNIFLDDRHLTNITKFGKKSKNQKKKKKKKKKKSSKKKHLCFGFFENQKYFLLGFSNFQ
jgi:hypothetical protein